MDYTIHSTRRVSYLAEPRTFPAFESPPSRYLLLYVCLAWLAVLAMVWLPWYGRVWYMLYLVPTVESQCILCIHTVPYMWNQMIKSKEGIPAYATLPQGGVWDDDDDKTLF